MRRTAPTRSGAQVATALFVVALISCGDADGDRGVGNDAGVPGATGGSNAGMASGSGAAGRPAAGGAGAASGAGGRGGSAAAGGSGAIDSGTARPDASVDPGSDAAAPMAGCSPPAPFDRGVTYERTLHVAMNGDDDGGDGSQAQPFASIDRALNGVAPGTRVLVHEGRYGPFSAQRLAGTAAKPIAIAADGAVVLEARGAQAIIGLSDPAYVVIEGFALEGATVHGMNIDDEGSYDTPAHHLVLRDLTIPSAGSGGNNDCIKLSGLDDFWVLDSDVGGCDRGEIIDMVGCHRGVIAGNHFHDAVQNGVQTKGGSADTLIHGNVFENIPARAVNAGGSTGTEFFRPADASYEAARISIIANVFVRNGEMSGAAVAYVGCDGCLFAHNTVIEPRSWVARILQESTDARFVPSRNGRFVNNLIVLEPSALRAELVNVGANTAPETFVFGNNLWYALGGAASYSPVLAAAIPPESGSILQQDPGLVDRANGDYHLTAQSPARARARALDPPPVGDFDSRCFADPAAIGAFEAP
jgi:hypothetical protein